MTQRIEGCSACGLRLLVLVFWICHSERSEGSALEFGKGTASSVPLRISEPRWL